MYTIIVTSGYQGDSWKLDSTHDTKRAAYARYNEFERENDPTSDTYNVKIATVSKKQGQEPFALRVILNGKRITAWPRYTQEVK